MSRDNNNDDKNKIRRKKVSSSSNNDVNNSASKNNYKKVSSEPKTFKIRIVDEDLLKETGGIVQGMSGTPIIQNNKIIGAVSHALENNPKIGYGVYIKWML